MQTINRETLETVFSEIADDITTKGCPDPISEAAKLSLAKMENAPILLQQLVSMGSFDLYSVLTAKLSSPQVAQAFYNIFIDFFLLGISTGIRLHGNEIAISELENIASR